jgi:hypothetical protein
MYTKEVKLDDSARVTESEVILKISKTFFVSSVFTESASKETFNNYIDGYNSFRGWETNDNTFIWGSQDLHFPTPEIAINAFLMNSENDNKIMALFERPEIIEFTLMENKVIYLLDDKYPTVISASITKHGDRFKNQLSEDQRFKDVYQEILREKSTFEKKEKEDRDREARDKRENNYHQWVWLERKRMEGEFNEFLNVTK